MQEPCYSARVGEAGAVHLPMRRLIPLALVLAAVVAMPASAGAAKLPKDVTRTTYRYPIDLRPGTNIIKIRFGVPKPQGAGYIVRFKPNLTRRDGSSQPLGRRPGEAKVSYMGQTYFSTSHESSGKYS